MKVFVGVRHSTPDRAPNLYWVHDVTSAEDARQFVASQVLTAKTILALVPKNNQQKPNTVGDIAA